MKLVTIAAAMCLMAPLALVTPGCSKASAGDNPFLKEYNTKYDIPPFEQIKPEHYIPAIKEGIKQHQAEIDSIVNNPDSATFENTILALDYSGDLLSRVSGVLFALTESMATPEMQKVQEEAEPLIISHNDEMWMNDGLFQRVKTVYEHRDTTKSTPERRAVEDYYRNFTRNGALLNPEQKKELMALNNELNNLYLTYNKQLLAATNAFEIVIDDSTRLAGLPASVVAQAAEAAGEKGKWKFTLHAPSRLPVLQYAADRDLRKQMYQGYTTLASQGENNNYPVINKILQARTKKARLLGYPSFAAYMTENVMAKTPQAAEELLMQLWKPAQARVAEEVKEMQAIVDKEGGDFKIEPWDYYYYAEKVRQDKYNLNETEVSEYFPVDSVVKGIFTLAEKLYGVKFTEMPDAPKYHPEVNVYDVTNANDGEHIAVFMTDYFPRATKRQGAWMDAIVNSCINLDGSTKRPIIYNVGNFTRPTADTPALLTIDEVETMFHEFGHGLHGMLSRAKLRSQSGTNVDRDFVELPSQINEHWALEPELLKDYAFHYKTGEVIPDSLIEKLNASSTHNQGFMTAELVGAALLDLAYGNYNADGDVDVAAFEADYAKKLGMPRELTFRYRSPYFKHIFGSDGYASGYYTYLWAEVLDTDGFELFNEKGIFDPATAKSFKENILEMGGSEDPMVLYERFRGHRPTPDALLRNRGLK